MFYNRVGWASSGRRGRGAIPTPNAVDTLFFGFLKRIKEKTGYFVNTL